MQCKLEENIGYKLVLGWRSQ